MQRDSGAITRSALAADAETLPAFVAADFT